MRKAWPVFAMLLFACGSSDGAGEPILDSDRDDQASGPAIHLSSDPNYMDTGWCHISFIPEQDPIFPTIRRDSFQATAEGIVITKQSWIEEAKTRVPELRAAADSRAKSLLQRATHIVGRSFVQKDFDFLLYFCPYFGGGSAIPGIFPIFPYLEAAVGALKWPDWLFTDQYLFHEVLHRYVIERVDYTRGTPILNALYLTLVGDAPFRNSVSNHLGRAPTDDEMTSYIGLVLTHIHVYAIMKRTYLSLGEAASLARIEMYETQNAKPHPSYVRAWRVVNGYVQSKLDAVIAEVR